MKPGHGLILSALLLSGIAALAQQAQPSLGEVVRQQKSAKKAARVITNEDIPSRPQQDVTPSPSSAKTVSSADAPKPEVPQEERGEAKAAKTDKEDTAGLAAMKQRLQELDNDEKDLASQVSRAEGLAKAEEDPARREVLQHVVTKQRESLEKAKAERSAINQKLDEQKKPEQK